MVIKIKTQEGKPQSDIILDQFHLLVGFEINQVETAFVKKKITSFSKKVDFVQILSGEDENGEPIGDYGHAFFYLTKNEIVETFFSFGPSGEGKIKMKPGNAEQPKVYADGAANGRPSTGSYEITEVVRIFRFEITEDEFNKIIAGTNKVLMKIENGKPYRAITNDTCAEEAQDILDDVLPWLPDGKGYIEKDGIIFPFKMVGPYAWAKQLYDKYKTAYTYPEYPTKGKGADKFTSEGEYPYSVEQWSLYKGRIDPLYNEGYYMEAAKEQDKASLSNHYAEIAG